MASEEKRAYIEFMRRRILPSPNIDCRVCSECGLMPCDVPDMSVQGITAMLDSGKYSIIFSFVRTIYGIIVLPLLYSREVGAGRVNHSLMRGKCALQTETGCSLTEEERPTLGLLLIPNEKENCRNAVSEEERHSEWLKCKEIMDEVVLSETGKTSEELFRIGCIEAGKEISRKTKNHIELTLKDTIVFNMITQVILSGFEFDLT